MESASKLPGLKSARLDLPVTNLSVDVPKGTCLHLLLIILSFIFTKLSLLCTEYSPGPTEEIEGFGEGNLSDVQPKN